MELTHSRLAGIAAAIAAGAVTLSGAAWYARRRGSGRRGLACEAAGLGRAHHERMLQAELSCTTTTTAGIDDNFLAALPHRHLMRGRGSGLPGIAWLKHVSLLPGAPASIIDRQLERTELHGSLRC